MSLRHFIVYESVAHPLDSNEDPQGPPNWYHYDPELPISGRALDTRLRWISDPEPGIADSWPVWAVSQVNVVSYECCGIKSITPDEQQAASSIHPHSGPLYGETEVTVYGNFSKLVGLLVRCNFIMETPAGKTITDPSSTPKMWSDNRCMMSKLTD